MNKNMTAGRDRRTTVLVAAGVTALATLLYLAVGQTNAAFTAQTSNPGNSFKTGVVTLSNDRVGSALFELDEMLPGHSDTQDITVTNTSTAPLGVRLYAGDYVAPTRAGSELAEHLEVTIDLLDADDEALVGNVFTGSMADFVAAENWQCGYWTDTDAGECNPAPVSTAGPLETALRQVIPDASEETAPFTPEFWAAVKSADTAVVNALKGVDTQTAAVKDRQPAAEAWEDVPTPLKDAIAENAEELFLAIEAAVADSPTVGEVAPIPTLAPAGGSTPAPVTKTYPELGDRLEEMGQADSARIYRIKVKLADDAGSYDINPEDSLSLSFVWEGRA